MNMSTSFSIYLLFSHTDCLIFFITIFVFFFFILLILLYIHNFVVLLFLIKNSGFFFACDTPTRYILATDPTRSLNESPHGGLTYVTDVDKQLLIFQYFAHF